MPFMGKATTDLRDQALSIPADRDIALLCFRTENTKCFMHFRSCQEALTFVRVERDEVKRPNSVKQPTKSRWPPRPARFELRRHDRSCVIVTEQSIRFVM